MGDWKIEIKSGVCCYGCGKYSEFIDEGGPTICSCSNTTEKNMNKTKYIFCAEDSIDRQMIYHGFESELSKEEILKQLSDLVLREGEVFPAKFLGLELFITQWLDNGEIPGLKLLTLEEFWAKSCKNKVVCI